MFQSQFFWGRYMGRLADLLQEESEHQWLMTAVFALIIIIGAFVIGEAATISGIQNGSVIPSDVEVVDIDVDSNGDFLLTTHGNEGYEIISVTETGKETMVNTDATIPASIESSSGTLVFDTSGVGHSVKIQTDSDLSNSAQTDNGLILNTGIAMSSGNWLVGGGWIAPSEWSGSSPAGTSIHSAVGIVEIDKDGAPAIRILRVGDKGMIHSILDIGGGDYLAAGTDGFVVTDGHKVEYHSYPSAAAATDSKGIAWLFQAMGSYDLIKYKEGAISIEELEEPMKFTPEVAGSNGDVIIVYGLDGDDDSASLTFDASAQSSITSLRGMMDFGFILFGGVALAVMLWNMWDAYNGVWT